MTTGVGRRYREPAVLAAVVATIAIFAVTGAVPPLWLLWQHLRALLWGSVVLATAFLQGWILCSLLTPDKAKDDPAFTASLASGLGMGLLSLELLLVGLTGFFTRPAITSLILVLLFSGLGIARFLKIRMPRAAFTLEAGTTLPLCLTGLAVFFNLYLALVPPVFFDAMSYHLELPSRYLQAGQVFHVSENLYSGYPQLVEILYGAGLALGGVDVAGVISLIGYLLVLGLVWSWGQRKFGAESAAWAAAIISFTPPLMLLVGFYHNEWYVTFFTLAVVMIIAETERAPGPMLLAGCMAGLAVGSKYTALAFALAVPFLAGAGLDILFKRRSSVKGWCAFVFSAALVASPWYLKNLIFTGDLLYPLLSGEVAGVSDLVRDTHFKGLHLADLWRWVLIPYDAVFRPWEIQFPMSMGALPVVLLPTLFTLRGKKLVSPFLLTWLFGSLTIWYATFRAGRFALPMIVLVLIWLSAGFRFAVRKVPGKGGLLTGTVVFLIFVNLGHVLGFVAAYADVLTGAFGKVTSEEYLRHTYAPYGAITYLNQVDPPPKKVLFLGEMKGFYSDFDREVATFEVPNRLMKMVRGGETPDEIAESLLAQGFSHILYNPVEMERLAAKTSQLRLDPEESDILDNFFRVRTEKVFMHSDISVWKLQHD